jgi:hypothetical protein
MVLFFMGCNKPETEKAPEFLIKTSLMGVDKGEFLEELDLKRAAYPYNISENPAEYNEMVMHLVKMLSEEIVLLSAAADRAVEVTDQEIQSARAEFQKDYPGDSFDEVMLKNAISYSLWEKRFKKNMIIDKLIDQELGEKIEISSRDIVEFYNTYQMAADGQSDADIGEPGKISDEQELVFRLRLQKTQERYDEWIQGLEDQYPVELNREELKTLLKGIQNSGGGANEKEN